jgi:hypothetical protein
MQCFVSVGFLNVPQSQILSVPYLLPEAFGILLVLLMSYETAHPPRKHLFPREIDAMKVMEVI